MSSRAGLLERAAQCEQQMNRETDEVRKAVFRLIRDMWVALANERSSMTATELARQIAAVETIQAGFGGNGRR